jgi:hypothetical protein
VKVLSSPLQIIVTGLIAQYPFGGMTWHYLQYVLGLARLGHEVYYVEDSGGWPYDPFAQGLGYTCDYNVQYLAGIMSRFGFAEHWAYRFSKDENTSELFGLSESRLRDVVASTDLLISVSGALDRPEDYRTIDRMVYIDTDPVITQLKLARGEPRSAERTNCHDLLFSFGERVTERMPETGHRWRPTRQPVILAEWATTREPRPVYTTVMNWSSYQSEVFQGQTYGQKNVEFMRFLDLPSRLPGTHFEIAGGPGHADPIPRELITGNGWRLVDPMKVAPDVDSYRSYIQSSRAEWSVAKNAYVQGCTGWFSERSACYLAAGRPVIVQDTGFSSVLPTGEGLLAFSSLKEAIDAIHEVESDYARHERAARMIAEEWFDSARVLSRLLEEVFQETTEPSRQHET